MPTKVSKFIDPEADRQQPPSMEGCGMSDSREAFEGHCARIGFVLKPDGGGDYLPGNGQELWSIWCASWQAARAGQAESVPDDRISVHEYTARIALQALEEYAENLSIVAGWDYEPLEHHYAQQAIEDIQDKLTEQEQGE